MAALSLWAGAHRLAARRGICYGALLGMSHCSEIEMIGRYVIALGVAALVGSAAMAAETGSKSNDPNKMVCRTISETGSRLSKTRACHTQAEWAELRRQTRQTVEHIQDERAAHLSN
jgi:hypothetical protein